MTSRREFLQSMAAASAAVNVAGSLRPRVPAAMLGRIGLELYTVRNEMQVNVEDTLDRVAAIGYRDVEFAGYFGREPAALRAKLDTLRLEAVASHVSLKDVETNWDSTASAAKTLGHKWLIVASLERGAFASVASLKAVAARLNEIGRRAAGAGLRFGYHNHSGEFTLVEGAVPFDVLLSETNSKLVDFEMDVYWITKGGADPLAYFAKYPGRFHLIHAKDSSGPPALEMRDVGAGTIDWKRVFAARAQAGIERVFVEHDNPKDAWASVRASYKYLRDLVF